MIRIYCKKKFSIKKKKMKERKDDRKEVKKEELGARKGCVTTGRCHQSKAICPFYPSSPEGPSMKQNSI